jgi:hypothetical protein
MRRLVPLFENGRMYLPREFNYTSHDKATLDLVKYFVEEELLSFPVSKFDDMLDSLSRIAEPDVPLPWPKSRDEDSAPPPDDVLWVPFDPVMGY